MQRRSSWHALRAPHAWSGRKVGGPAGGSLPPIIPSECSSKISIDRFPEYLLPGRITIRIRNTSPNPLCHSPPNTYTPSSPLMPLPSFAHSPFISPHHTRSPPYGSCRGPWSRPFAPSCPMPGAVSPLMTFRSADSCSEIARISRACMASSPHDRPTFAILMHELASLEDRVRMDGMRISKSFDAASGRAFSLLSSDATALQHVRTRTSCDLPKQRASLDVAVLFPSAARVAATAAAAATASAAPSSHRGSHGGPPPASRETCFRGRLSVDTSCRPGSQMGLYHAQPSTGASGDAGPVSHHQGTHAVPPSTKDTHAIPRAAGCIAGMCREGAQLGGEDKDAMLCCGGRVGNGCDVQQVNVVDPTGGGHSGGGCAAAIAAALAQQPNIATAVVYELLALLQQQQQPQQEQPRPEADGDMTNWAANAAGRRIIEIVGGGNLGHHSGGGLGTTAALQEPPLPAPSLALYPATINTCGPGCLADCGQPPSRPDGASEDKGYATPLAASRVLQPPRRSTSCGDSVLLGTAQAAPADGSAAAAAAGVAACGIERSRTDSVLESSGGACANHGDDGAWGECVEVASMALSSPGRWVAGSSLAPAESPLLTAADVVRDGIAAAAANAQHRQLPQQCNSSGAVMCGVSLARRRSSNLSISCRNSTVAGWECTTITEEPT
ncbi:hypothetical protein Vretifemale_10671 [Volvox reticuliferus]|uniref:Uncharacterized protein n=1 Tax=Volvox reticuliferus TaxID=1737510 RepID=A0A8J4FLU0_9CHLO|nr:hypothetical protein Vretifemale_10671 [Volvox reticuliferus]